MPDFDPSLLEPAFAARAAYIDERREAAFRLFNGHLEGDPRFVLDVYARTLVLHHYGEAQGVLEDVIVSVLSRLPWLTHAIIKERKGDERAKRGRVVYRHAEAGGVDTSVREGGVRYALDLLMNQDASFYLDTRPLRAWLRANMAGKEVLNTFAYTGSLGVAAQAGGASRVLHTDLNKRFLNVAKTSYSLNGFPIEKRNFQVGDFWPLMNSFKKGGLRFDCVILDPPFFSSTPHGTVDLAHSSERLINKVRPLVKNGGKLVAVNNSLYLSGAEYMAGLEKLGKDGWVEVDSLINIEPDITGFDGTRRLAPVTDPAPFNHATKIAVLTIRHKE